MAYRRKKVRESTNAHLVKIRFDLEVDEDGWPPFAAEWIWAKPLGGKLYNLDNSPWWVKDVSWKDVVEATSDSDECLVFVQVVEPSEHTTIRIIARKASVAQMKTLMARLNEIGCTYEGELGWKSMFAVDIPPDVDYSQIVPMLDDGEAKDLWAYEEGCLRHCRD